MSIVSLTSGSAVPTCTIEDLRATCKANGFSVEEDSLSEKFFHLFQNSFDAVCQTVKNLSEYEDPRLAPAAVEGGDRTFYRPDEKENPMNGWAHKTTLKSTDPKAANGPLAGRTIAFKDNVSVGGLPLGLGASPEHFAGGKHPISTIDATVVGRVLAAGGIVKGTATCENFSLFPLSYTSNSGVVHNAWLPGYATGGSSSGCGTLVSVGDVEDARANGKDSRDYPLGEGVDIAVGGDQGGSIRLPASYSGIFGLKPTHGLVPYSGIAPLNPLMDHTGPMARTVEDTALLLGVMAGYDGIDPRMTPDSPTVARVPDYLGDLNAWVANKRAIGEWTASSAAKGLRIGILKEVRPVDVEALRSELRKVKGKVQAVTVSLINSWVNGEHEKEVGKIVKEVLGDEVEVSLSHEVLPELGEYERTVTAAANSVVKPEVKRYMKGLSEKLNDDTPTVRILKSDGGLTNLELAGELPVNILMSGPAGGVRGITSIIANATEHKNLVTLDMGGTSTDVALIANAQPSLRRETMVGDLAVRSPSVDVRTIGAGGGSLAFYSKLTNTLRVGPESSGANPGPACYGRGGSQATVTDANLVLGYLPENLLGGEFHLDVKAARAAVGKLAEEMGKTIFEAAEAIIDLANETIYGALRLVSVEQGHNPADFALVAFGGAGPMCANAVGKLLGAWPVIVPAAPGILCAQGDATTKMSHELSASFIQLLGATTMETIRGEFSTLREKCEAIMKEALDEIDPTLEVTYTAALRYRGQALELPITLIDDDLSQPMEVFEKIAHTKFDKLHEQQFSYTLENFPIELTRLTVTIVDASPDIEIPHIDKADSETPPESGILETKTIIVQGKEHQAKFWSRSVLMAGHRVQGPCVVVEMDSNTLIAPGFEGVVDSVGNICIMPLPGNEMPSFKSRFESTVSDKTQEEKEAEARKVVEDIPTLPTLISSSLASIRAEMDTLMLRCSMSPAIREQQDEFNVITNAAGQMLVGQFGSFIGQFLKIWTYKVNKGDVEDIEEGDVFITNDVYEVEGAVSHLNDVIVLLPIYFEHKLVGWAANFGHMTDVQGQVPGSMSINAQTIFDDGLQVPTMKLFEKGKMNKSIVDLMCRNSRQPEWLRSDLLALISACRTAATRVCELCTRFGPEVYAASTDILLERTRTAVSEIIEHHMSDETSTFVDFVDDDGHGRGPFALKCTLSKTAKNRLKFDFNGTSPQASSSINYFLSEKMFKMFVGYYLLVVHAPFTIPNDGFHDLIDVEIPLGSLLKPVRPASLSCRTHFLGRTMDIMQALFGQRNEAFMTAAGFSDSPHFFYSGFKSDGEWYQLYQIAFGGVPARPKGDGPDCHCLFPAIKSVPTESIELNFPVRLEVNEAVADSGGAGFYRGGNAQKTCYRFLSAGEFSIHDDRWFTKPWGVRGGKPGSRSRKAIHRIDGTTELLPSKCDHVKVKPGDLLEWQTWGGGGLGDPLTRPAETVALEVRRKLVTVDGAKTNYGVVIDPETMQVDEMATETFRADVEKAEAGKEAPLYDRGGTLAELAASCKEETGFDAPTPQWDEEIYGPHVALPYVQDWYKKGREVGYKVWDV